MRLYNVIVRRVVEIIGGAGFIAGTLRHGITLVQRLELIATQVAAAARVTFSEMTWRTSQTPSAATSLLNASGTVSADQTPAARASQSSASLATSSVRQFSGTVLAQSLHDVARSSHLQFPTYIASPLAADGSADQERQRIAPRLSAVIRDHKEQEAPAGQVIRVRYDLARRAGANAQSPVGTAWTNPSNAVGEHDGTVATSSGGVLAVTRGIELGYADSSGKGELTITDARLYVYAEVTGDVTGLLTDVTISYDVGAGQQTLEVVEGNFSNLDTPREYALGVDLDAWSEYDALTARIIVSHAAASAGVVARLDAIEVQVTAARTDQL